MTPRDIETQTIHEALIEDHRHDNCRSGEGSVAVLNDGSLYMVYTRFEGGGDEDRATLVARRSADGIHWSGPQTFRQTPKDALNLMSVSLLSLQDGRLAAVYLHKTSTEDCRPMFLTSADDGRTWSEPACMIAEPDYYVVNNDRLVQLSNGRLLLPFSHALDGLGRGENGCLISDDRGRTWRMGACIRIERQHILEPKAIDPRNTEAVKAIQEGDVHPQEPGVVELLDGRVMMWCRSTGGYAYRSISDDGGQTWGPYQAIPEFAMPNGPQSIKRLPASDRLMMLFNDRGLMPYGDRQFSWRRPLSVAVSDDDAQTWRPLGLLEPDTIPSCCYYSICFHSENVILTYYQGAMQTRPDGIFMPRNLASMKLKIVRRRYFES